MSNAVKNWTEWLKNTRFAYMTEEQKTQTINWLLIVRNNILNLAEIKKGDTIIDIGSGTGLLAFGAYELIGNDGKIIVSDKFDDCLEECKKFAESLNIPESVIDFKNIDASDINLPDQFVDVIVMRSVLCHILDKQKPMNEFYRILKREGRISFYEPVISSNARNYELVDIDKLDIADKIVQAEESIMNNSNNPLTNFSAETIQENLHDAGFREVLIKPVVETSTYPVKEGMIDTWLSAAPSPGSKSMTDLLLEHLTKEEFLTYKEFLTKETLDQNVTIATTSLYCVALKL